MHPGKLQFSTRLRYYMMTTTAMTAYDGTLLLCKHNIIFYTNYNDLCSAWLGKYVNSRDTPMTHIVNLRSNT